MISALVLKWCNQAVVLYFARVRTWDVNFDFFRSSKILQYWYIPLELVLWVFPSQALFIYLLIESITSVGYEMMSCMESAF